MSLLQLLRPHQWVKNVFVFAGLVFGGRMTDASAVMDAFIGFGCLCLVSSTVYVFNDIHDREEDRLHPRKSKRPIASGKVSVAQGVGIGVATLIAGLGGSFLLDKGFSLVVLTYLVVQGLYTHVLKHVVLLDVIAIAIGFVLRAISGAVLVHVTISHWLVICTFTLCLFMGFGKRRCELLALGANGSEAAERHRKTLASYTVDLLNQMTTLTAGIAIITFLLYATDQRTIREVFHTHYLVYTLPLVVYAIFRFALLVEHGRVDGPTDVVLRDRPFQIAMVIWVLIAMLLLYRGQHVQSWLDSIIGVDRPE